MPRSWPVVRVLAAIAVAALAVPTAAAPTAAVSQPVGGAPAWRSVAAAAPQPTVGGPLLARRGVVVHKTPGVRKLPSPRAASWLIADYETGEVLAAKDAHGHYSPASTLKILTAITLIPRLDPNQTVRPSSRARDTEGSAVGLETTMRYRLPDLFRGLMMASGNDAAIALAEAYGGLRPTLAAMNAEAHRLQAYDTVAKTPNGLDRKGQRSSAYDLALMARAGLETPAFREYVRTKVARFPAPKTKKKSYELWNHNKLLWQYRGAIGVKNGWTLRSRSTYVGAAARGGHTIIVTLMRHPGGFYPEVKKMLDWGFAARGKVKPVGHLVSPQPLARSSPPPPGTAHSASSALPPAANSRTSPLLPIAAGTAVLAVLCTLGYCVRRRRRRSDTTRASS